MPLLILLNGKINRPGSKGQPRIASSTPGRFQNFQRPKEHQHVRDQHVEQKIAEHL